MYRINFDDHGMVYVLTCNVTYSTNSEIAVVLTVVMKLAEEFH